MKHTWRDGLTILSVVASLAIAGFIAFLAYPWVVETCGVMSPLVVGAVFCLGHGILVTAYLWILNRIWRIPSGTYGMEEMPVFLWKHHAVLRSMAESFLKPFFPVFLRAVFYRILGAKVGKDVAVSGMLEDPQMTTLGDYAIVGSHSCLTAHALVYGKLVVEPIVIGRGATIGVNAVIMPGVEVGDYSVVAAGAVVPPGTRIGRGELWGGVPAKKIKNVEAAVELGLAPDEVASVIRPLRVREPAMAGAGIGEREEGWN